MNYKFRLTCVDGGKGWGKTGQRMLMCIKGDTREEAIANLQQHLPGGWTYVLIGPTIDTYYLKHLRPTLIKT